MMDRFPVMTRLPFIAQPCAIAWFHVIDGFLDLIDGDG